MTFVPCPKPPKHEKAAPKPLKRMAEKKLRALGGKVYSTIVPKANAKPNKPRARITPKRRTPEEMTRIYGPPARRRWLKAFPCIICVLLLPLLALSNRVWKSDIAHVAPPSEKGTGYKASAAFTVPMCREHHHRFDHRLAPCDTPTIRAFVVAAAAKFEAAWQKLLASNQSPAVVSLPEEPENG